MTRSECFSILNDKNNPQYKELHHIFYSNRNKCREYYESIGEYKPGMVLHHKVFNCDNYEEWKIDEIIPMEKSEHSRLHYVVYKQGLGKEGNLEKAHESLKKKYESGELSAWNKGLTAETDDRIKQSPRKGKTGKDFPFLCASKKGKSGGWNKGITKDDPRYESLLFTDEQRSAESARMKELSASGKNDSFIYSCKDTIFINNGIENKRIKKDCDIPIGWVKGRIRKKV